MAHQGAVLTGHRAAQGALAYIECDQCRDRESDSYAATVAQVRSIALHAQNWHAVGVPVPGGFKPLDFCSMECQDRYEALGQIDLVIKDIHAEQRLPLSVLARRVPDGSRGYTHTVTFMWGPTTHHLNTKRVENIIRDVLRALDHKYGAGTSTNLPIDVTMETTT